MDKIDYQEISQNLLLNEASPRQEMKEEDLIRMLTNLRSVVGRLGGTTRRDYDVEQAKALIRKLKSAIKRMAASREENEADSADDSGGKSWHADQSDGIQGETSGAQRKSWHWEG
jgi:hypothetical protein